MDCTMVMTRSEMDADRNKWLELRQTGLGGSDAGVVAGLNAWKTPFTLWMEKTGQAEAEDLSTKEAIKWGNRLEDAIANAFTEDTGKKVRKCGMLRSTKYPWMLADVDRMVEKENAILEIKTTASWNKAEWENDSLPDTYYCQVLHYMIVSGADRAYVYCLMGGQEAIFRTVEYNDEDAQALIEAERKFWEEYVAPKKLPPVDGTTSCTKALKQRFQGGDPEAFEFDEAADKLLQDRERYKNEINKLEITVATIENKIRLMMENAEFGKSSTYNVWYKARTKTGFDAKAFEKDYPDLYKKYKKESPYRALLIKVSRARARED